MGSVLHAERLKGLDSRIIFFVWEAAKRVTFDVLVVSGVRTEEQQQALYAQGRTAPGKIVTHAEHAEDTPHGRRAAVDVCPSVNGVPQWDEPSYYDELAAIAQRMGIVWGGNFPNLADRDHFQLPNWRELPMEDDDLTPTDRPQGVKT